jgi:hypothetical protein
MEIHEIAFGATARDGARFHARDVARISHRNLEKSKEPVLRRAVILARVLEPLVPH